MTRPGPSSSETAALLITASHGRVEPAALGSRERDTLVLTWEERRWTRKRVITTRGREVALALPTGSVLRPGDVLAIEDAWYLAVEASPEAVLAARPRDRAEAIRIAFEVGNRHVSLALDGDALLVPDDAAMEQLLDRLRVDWERRRAVFDPVGAGHRHQGQSPLDGHTHRPASGGEPRTAAPSETSSAARSSGVDAHRGTAAHPGVGDPPPMDSARLVSVLQFADSAFPAGGYAHSFGLEAYVQAGIVRDRHGVLAFLCAYLEGAVGPSEATAAVASREALGQDRLDECRRLDEALEAMKPVRELREASRQMGRQTLRVASALSGDERLGAYLRAVESGGRPGHHAVAFGMAGGALGWEAPETATALLHSSAAQLVGTALRLLPLGQLEGQRLLRELHPLIERLAGEAATRPACDMWSFCPGLEVEGMRHERLPARLFRS